MKYIIMIVFLPVILLGVLCALLGRAFICGVKVTDEYFEKRLL